MERVRLLFKISIGFFAVGFVFAVASLILNLAGDGGVGQIAFSIFLMCVNAIGAGWTYGRLKTI